MDLTRACPYNHIGFIGFETWIRTPRKYSVQIRLLFGCMPNQRRVDVSFDGAPIYGRDHASVPSSAASTADSVSEPTVSFQILFHRQRVDFRKRSRRLTHIKLARDHISDKAKSVVHRFE